MSPLLQSVTSGLRRELAKSTGTFLVELEGRVRHLVGNMVDGQELTAREANLLRVHILDLVRREALPRLSHRPDDAIRILDLLLAYGHPELEPERARVEAARAALYPASAQANLPEIARILALAERPGCVVRPPSKTAYFAERLRRDKVAIPSDLVAAYSAFDGFDLTCAIAPHVRVFSLLPTTALDVAEAAPAFASAPGMAGPYPRRVVAFQGGDCVDLAVGTDPRSKVWLVYEHDGMPIARRPFDLGALFAFALERRDATALEDLEQGLSWQAFFGADG